MIKSGAFIPILIMLPNFLWMLFPAVDTSESPAEPLPLTIIENAGRIVAMVIPFFYNLRFDAPISALVVILMGLALLTYYIAWGRYFTNGRAKDLMRASLFGIPLPMAITPIAFLLLSSYLIGSWWMLIASLLFGAAHIYISAKYL